MLSSVKFRFATEWVDAEGNEGILGTNGVGWFIEMLKRLDGFEAVSELIQEDSGVILRFTRRGKKFKAFVGFYGIDVWWVYFDHRGILQELTPSGRREYSALAMDIDRMLKSDTAVSDIGWGWPACRGEDKWEASPKNA